MNAGEENDFFFFLLSSFFFFFFFYVATFYFDGHKNLSRGKHNLLVHHFRQSSVPGDGTKVGVFVDEKAQDVPFQNRGEDREGGCRG